MAIIGSIRKRGGLIAIIIFVALAAFVLTMNGPGRKSGLMSCSKVNETDVGSICGENITWIEFENQVDAQVELVKQQTGNENVTEEQRFQIRNELWTKLERDYILKQEYDALGIVVSDDELNDLVQGNEPHQYIVQNFTDAQGVFDVLRVRSFVENLDQYEEKSPGTRAQWETLLESIAADRMYTKYLSLITKGYYVPTALAQKDYEQKNTKAVFRFVAQKYSTIPDNSVTLTDEDYQKYYEEHKNEYEQDDATRDLEYVVFDVVPSDSDVAFASREVDKIYAEMKGKKDAEIPEFVNNYSDYEKPYDSTFYKKGALPANLDTLVFEAKKGDILGPFYQEYEYTIAKVMKFQERPDSMRASHILVAYSGSLRAAETVTRTKEQAEKMADSLITVLKKTPKLWDTIALKHSDDPTAKAKVSDTSLNEVGDLDWFADGAMVGPFNEACVDGKVGDLQKVETPFGYHIVKVTDKKELINKVRLAVISRIVKPSKETQQIQYDLASKFAGENTTAELFEKAVIDNKLNKKLAENLTPMTNTITGLESPREIIKWAFADTAKKGDVSTVPFSLTDMYVVVCLKEVREKGIPPMEQVKTQLEPYVKREKKAETLMAKVKGLVTPGADLYALASKLDSTSVDTLDFITFSSYSLPGYGPEPEVLGKLFTLKENTLSDPIKGKAGVFVVQVDSIIKPAAVKDYKTTITQMITTFQSRATYDVYNALEKNAEIIDNRIKWY